MEVRRSLRKKRKTDRELEMELAESQIQEALNQQGEVNVGTRDATADHDTVSVKTENVEVKQEVEIESDQNWNNFDFVKSDDDVKVEPENVKYIVTEEVAICSDHEEGEKQTEKNSNKIVSNLPETCHHADGDSQNCNICVKKMLERVLEHLDFNKILLCRLVNKTWRSVVDDFLQSKVMEGPYDDKQYLSNMWRYPEEQVFLRKYRRLKYSYHFTCLAESYTHLQQFYLKMADHRMSGLSPFVGGGEVTLEDMLSGNSAHKKCVVDRFFKLFGKHIVSLQIRDWAQVDVQLLRYLALTPNLKRLAVKFPFCEKFSEKFTEFTQNLVAFSLNPVQRCSYYFTPQIDGKFINEQKLRMLKMNLPVKLPINFWNLNELTLRFRNNYNDEFASFAQESLSESSVQKLHVKMLCDHKINFAKIMTLIEKLPSLRYFKLSDYKLRIISYQAANFTAQNNIHTLELKTSSKNVPHEFFRAFPKLRYLKMSQSEVGIYYKSKNGDLENTLNLRNLFLDPMRSIYVTRLWEIVPSLEIIALKFRSGYRWPECNPTWTSSGI